MSKRIGSLLILLLTGFFLYMGYAYLHYREVHAVSDAAFIKSDRIAILSFRVNGKVAELTKEENDPVRKGELLGRIDPKDFKVAEEKLLHVVAAIEKRIAALRLKRGRLEKTLRLRERISDIDIDGMGKRMASLAFRIDAARKRLEKLELDAKRYRNMMDKRLISRSDYENVVTRRDALSDDIDAMKQELAVLGSQKRKTMRVYEIARLDRRQISELEKEIVAKEEELKANRQSLRAIRNQIAYTRLIAPFDGVIAKKFTDAPRVVESGSPIYALADPQALYCEALLSEKKLHGIRPGNEVEIEVDAIKDKTYHGKVESIAPTSASTFSLVPRDIASGEFTKLDQRFVVRIKLDDIEGLRAGMGATVAIARSGD
jgi:membrane fusion protein (multidrug efflux system)